jgi:hypothetical protein
MKIYHRMSLVFVSLLLVLPMTVTVVFAKNDDSKTTARFKKNHSNITSVRNSKLKHPTAHIAEPQAKNNELEKVLDLSPSGFGISESIESPTPSNQPGSNSIFVAEKKHQRSLTLDGQLLMSQEPEADKKKSMDGASINIILKR